MIDRKELHHIVDKLPEEKLPKMAELFHYLIEEDEEFNDVTKQEIEEGLKAYRNGEFIALDEHLNRLR
ncbi:hypothetical protein [Salicibibacter kimchii]|uniref:DUF2281 domain-containing protein n=1 Tax=Salicibibacter kimchii TaxID=2099786 RepID=A0A345BWK0_9BACI|nr:hypothetical protein [Salicibibacter kimchii]AXF55331.1 hypothetical protein DT065_04370 [Salicibibacter kimchii]